MKQEVDIDDENSGERAASDRRRGAGPKRARDIEGSQKEVRTAINYGIWGVQGCRARWVQRVQAFNRVETAASCILGHVSQQQWTVNNMPGTSYLSWMVCIQVPLCSDRLDKNTEHKWKIYIEARTSA